MEALAPWHVLVVAIVALGLLFGWKQLPDMSRSLGRSLRIFKTEISDLTNDATHIHNQLAGPGPTSAPIAGPTPPVLLSDTRTGS